MLITTGKVHDGTIQLDGESLPEGAIVTVLTHEGDETFELGPEQETHRLRALDRKSTRLNSSHSSSSYAVFCLKKKNIPLVGGRPHGRNLRARPQQSVVARLSAGRSHAGDRAARPPAHRRQGRQALTPARRPPKSVCTRPRRLARCRARSRLWIKSNDLLLFCRTLGPRRAHGAGARSSARCRSATARRGEGDLPPAGTPLARPALWVPHRANSGHELGSH